MGRVKPWLAPFTWEIVTAQNAVLCQYRCPQVRIFASTFFLSQPW